ncbi:MAG: NEW3 domain-containing protein [Haloarculaceae archaeon]
MRQRTLSSLVALLVLGTTVATGIALAAGPGPGDEVRVNGTVTGVDGGPASDAVVLFGDSMTLTDHSTSELRDLAAADPANLTVVSVGSDGRYEATVAWKRAEAAVALSDTGISDLVWFRSENGTRNMTLYERRPQTVHAHLGAVSHDERRAELLVNLVNNGETTVENLTVEIDSLPDGWSVAEVTSNGSYDPETGTLTWSSIPPGRQVDTEVALTVPEDATPGKYVVELRAASDTHLVSLADARETVEVLPEETAKPTLTPTATPGDGGTTRSGETPTATADGETPTAGGGKTPATGAGGGTATASDRGAGTPSTTAAGPGLTVVAALSAVVALALLFVRRR